MIRATHKIKFASLRSGVWRLWRTSTLPYFTFAFAFLREMAVVYDLKIFTQYKIAG